MRILLVSDKYAPEPIKIITDLAEELQVCGHEVTVLTGFPNYPTGRLFPGYLNSLWMNEEINGVRILRVPVYPDHSPSRFMRAASFLSFGGSATVVSPFLCPRVDLIHVMHPPLVAGFPAWLLSRLRHVPLTIDIQDMWPEVLHLTGMMTSMRILKAFELHLGWLYRRSAGIRVVTPGFKEALKAKGVPEEKVQVIFNWADTEFYRPVQPDPELAETTGLAGRFNIVYVGNMGPAQGLYTVIEAADKLREMRDLQFVFVGDGTQRASLQASAEAKGLSNVRFLGWVDEKSIPRLVSLGQVMLVHLRNHPLSRSTIPHKTYTYMAMAKPVLAAVDGDTARVVTDADCGIPCHPGDADALVASIERFRAMSSLERDRMGRKGREAVCALYSRKACVRQMSEMFEKILDDCGRHHGPR